MALHSGQRIGPYEVVSPIGAGGMGEVYRAHDTKLGRDVAVKVLPADLSGSPDALARFEREARAIAALSHPNILAIHDFGIAGGISYAAMELLEGESLRDVLMTAPLPARRAAQYAIEIAHGLAAAHDKGIVHRDLKPENVFVTRDDRVKILDFGLARQDPIGAPAGTLAATVNSPTEPGTLLGTVGYMAPEQVRGLAADWRADIFSFGAVLYEMLTGVRAFARDTPAETIAAILRDDPSDPPTPIPPALDRIARRCLEKKPEARFRSAHDLAFALEAAAGSATTSSAPLRPIAKRPSRPSPLAMSGAIAIVAAAALLGFRAGRATQPNESAPHAVPTFRQLTFNRGLVTAARFAPDSRTVAYTAAWSGGAPHVLLTRIDSAGATQVATPPARLFAVSAGGEIALGLNPDMRNPNFMSEASLVRIPLLGGAAQPIFDRVTFADWNAEGTALAVVRVVGAQQRLEYPAGTVLFETAGDIGYPRVAPDGKSVAFFDWPVRNDDRGQVKIVGVDRVVRTVSRTWEALRGLAWRPDGREVWYTAAAAGTTYAIWASRSKPDDERQVFAAPGGVVLHDIDKDGRALVARFDRRMEVEGSLDGVPVDLSWMEFSFARDISKDGQRVLFTYSGQGSSPSYDVYVRGTRDPDASRIGEGQAQQFSPDGKSVLAIVHGPPSRVVILPIGPGDLRTVPTGAVTAMHARWLPGGQRLLLVGAEPGHGIRAYVLDLSSGSAPRPITPERIRFVDQIAVSNDGTRVVFRSPDDAVTIYPIDGGNASAAQGFAADEMAIGWTADDQSLVVIDVAGRRLVSIDPRTGRRSVLRAITPSNAALIGPTEVMLTGDGRSYVANYQRREDVLFLVEGLR